MFGLYCVATHMAPWKSKALAKTMVVPKKEKLELPDDGDDTGLVDVAKSIGGAVKEEPADGDNADVDDRDNVGKQYPNVVMPPPAIRPRAPTLQAPPPPPTQQQRVDFLKVPEKFVPPPKIHRVPHQPYSPPSQSWQQAPHPPRVAPTEEQVRVARAALQSSSSSGVEAVDGAGIADGKWRSEVDLNAALSSDDESDVWAWWEARKKAARTVTKQVRRCQDGPEAPWKRSRPS